MNQAHEKSWTLDQLWYISEHNSMVPRMELTSLGLVSFTVWLISSAIYMYINTYMYSDIWIYDMIKFHYFYHFHHPKPSLLFTVHGFSFFRENHGGIVVSSFNYCYLHSKPGWSLYHLQSLFFSKGRNMLLPWWTCLKRLYIDYVYTCMAPGTKESFASVICGMYNKFLSQLILIWGSITE